eukprot:scaffold2736_cov82-Skeletonema_dohrnii-CCMP3373.AAC.14
MEEEDYALRIAALRCHSTSKGRETNCNWKRGSFTSTECLIGRCTCSSCETQLHGMLCLAGQSPEIICKCYKEMTEIQ